MSRKSKLLKKFLAIPPRRDLTYDELETLMNMCGFDRIEGKGSAVKFYHHEADLLISLHRPHPGNILKHYIVRQLQIKLKEMCDG